jgi:hypothetical protein
MYLSHWFQSPRDPAWNPTQLEKAGPSAWGDVKPDTKAQATTVGGILPGVAGGRDRFSNVGQFLGNLNLEGLDAAQMDDQGGVTDEILADQIKILAVNEVLDSGEETMGVESEDEESFSGRGTHTTVATYFKAGDRVLYLGKEGDGMRLGYVDAVHGEGKGGPPF